MCETIGNANSWSIHSIECYLWCDIKYSLAISESHSGACGHVSTEIRRNISNYTHSFLWHAITHPCHNFNGGLAKPSLTLGLGWVFTSHGFMQESLFIYVKSDPWSYLVWEFWPRALSCLCGGHSEDTSWSNSPSGEGTPPGVRSPYFV